MMFQYALAAKSVQANPKIRTKFVEGTTSQLAKYLYCKGLRCPEQPMQRHKATRQPVARVSVEPEEISDAESEKTSGVQWRGIR